MILIKNAHVLDPCTGTDGIYHIVVKGTQIDAVLTDLPENEEEYEQTIDAQGWIAAPGLVDTHVHFRDPGQTEKEDIISGAAAAAKGGFTTVICMANTKPPVDNVQILRQNLEKGQTTGIRVKQAVTVTQEMKGKKLADMETLAQAGAAGFTDDGLPIVNEELLLEAMKRAAALNLPISLHEEDPTFLASPGVNQGKMSQMLGVGGASALAEDVLVARDCMLALHTGADVVIQHISSANSVHMVRAAKAMGAKVYAEATPHHFTLTEEAVAEHGTYARMNPPLRLESDRQEIIRGLQDGTIDMIATDHAPHTVEEKKRPFAEAMSGIIGLETSLALGVTELVRPGYLTMMQLLERMTSNPARLYHLNDCGIQAGAPADLVLFAPEETFQAGNYVSKAENTPFTGRILYAPVKYTICDGKIVYKCKD